MLAGMSLGTDIKRYSRGVMPRVAIIAIIFLPLMYGALYLWAFWNPFNEVDQIPAALVNSDRGAEVEGEKLNAGDQVVDALLESKQLDLTVVDHDEAMHGLKHGKYYFTIELEEEFSEAIVSPMSDDPRQAKLIFTFNDANNYLSTIIAQDAAAQVLDKVSTTIGAQTLDEVITTVISMLPKVDQAVDGAAELAAGLVTAHEGSEELAAGTGELSGAIDSAVTPLEGLAGRIQGLPADEVAAIGDRLESVASSVEAVAGTGAQALSAIDRTVLDLRSNGDPISAQAADLLEAAADRGAEQAGIDPSTVTELRAIQSESRAIAAELGDPSSPVSMALELLRSGQLEADLKMLQAAGTELNDGATELASGLGELSAGADELASGLEQAKDSIPQITDAQGKKIADTVAGPVELEETTLNEATTFGTGFAPFFLSLALFVGGIITWMLITPVQSRPVVNGLGAIRVALASYWPALLIGICQVLVMYVVVHFGVGLKPVYTAGTIFFLMLVAATWLAMIQALNAIFGPAVGRVVTLALLMVMLVSSGGIYPYQTTAKVFQWLHPADPMTYSVNGLRAMTVGGVDARFWIACAVLIGLILVSLAATSLSARRNRQYNMERLYPPVLV